MERLEAAMVKARAARQAALGRKVSGKAAAGLHGNPDPVLVDPLPGLQITPEIAKRQRLGAMLGTAHATPHDILRSRVVRLMAEGDGTHAYRRLAITSPTAQCGKTTVALNLALSLSRYGQLRLMLVDFDLRRPTLAKLLELRDPPEIAGLLQGGALKDHAFSCGENLALIPNARPVPQSAEVLQSAATFNRIAEIEEQWKPDLVLFDLPPMKGNDDTLGFLPHVDCALIVVAAEESTVSQIDRCEAEVRELTHVLGVVLNKCRYQDSNTDFEQGYY